MQLPIRSFQPLDSQDELKYLDLKTEVSDI